MRQQSSESLDPKRPLKKCILPYFLRPLCWKRGRLALRKVSSLKNLVFDGNLNSTLKLTSKLKQKIANIYRLLTKPGPIQQYGSQADLMWPDGSFGRLIKYCIYLRFALEQEVAKRCRLSWLTNSALVYEPKTAGGQGEGGFAGSQPMSTAACTGAQINFGDLTPYLTYALERRRGPPHTKREAALLAPPLPTHSPKVTLIRSNGRV